MTVKTHVAWENGLIVERHKLDVLALVSGLVFVGVAVVGLLDAVVLRAADLRWLGPLALVLFGAVLVLTAGSRQAATSAPDAAPQDADLGDGDPHDDAVREGGDQA